MILIETSLTLILTFVFGNYDYLGLSSIVMSLIVETGQLNVKLISFGGEGE